MKLNSSRKAKSREVKKIAYYKTEVEECYTKLQRYRNSGQFYSSITLQEKNCNLTKNEVVAIQEILSAAKKKNSRCRRYSEEWFLLCMLFHMGSPAGYAFISNHKIFPAPCVRSVRRYLSQITSSCGFDTNFFELHKTVLAKKDDKDKQRASKALDIMFPSLTEPYAQPIAVFASHDAVVGT